MGVGFSGFFDVFFPSASPHPPPPPLFTPSSLTLLRRGSLCVVQPGHKFIILLPPFHMYWDYRPVSPPLGVLWFQTQLLPVTSLSSRMSGLLSPRWTKYYQTVLWLVVGWEGVLHAPIVSGPEGGTRLFHFVDGKIEALTVGRVQKMRNQDANSRLNFLGYFFLFSWELTQMKVWEYAGREFLLPLHWNLCMAILSLVVAFT